MVGNRAQLKILLLQIRDEPRVRREEHESFARYAGVSLEQIEVFNVFDQPMFGPDIVIGYDALFVGGASEASVLEPDLYPFVPHGERLLMSCADSGFPVFASCFGFQLAAQALGATITRNTQDFEMGTIPISLAETAKADPLFCDTPDGFLAVSVHQESTDEAPRGTTGLAFTDVCCHAFKVDERPFWAFQFHPEVDRKTLVERLTIFKSKYTAGDDHLDAVLGSARETTESNSLVTKFVDRVLLARSRT